MTPAAAPETIVVEGPTRLGAAEVARIAFEGHRVELRPECLAAVRRAHEAAGRALRGAGPVYGVTTGQGYFAGRALAEDEARRHQRNLLLGRAVGSEPWLPVEEVRALMAVRLARFLDGAAAVSPELCLFIADRLNDGFSPAVPRTGVGCAGEVIPLSHAFQALVGAGRVLEPGGGLRAAGTALAARGVAPYELRAKEGIALLAGSPGTTALAIARHRACSRLARLALLGAACAIDAANVPLDAYDPDVARLAGDPLLGAALARLGGLLEGADPSRPGAQGPVSFRVAPQLIVHLERALGRVGEDIDRAMRSSDDSPAFVDGRFLSTGAFHEIELAAGMDALAAALARVAELAAQRVHRLLDSRFTGLPDQLTPMPGPRCGLVVLQKRSAGVLNELRRLAAPASVGLIDTSLGQEDAQTFGFEAAEKLRRCERLAEDVLAVELLTARQAWALRGRPPAPGLAAVAGALTAAIPPVDEDRPLGEDVERVLGLLRAL